MPRNPFHVAEDYIQLRKKCAPESWGDFMIRINEMVITPLILIFFICIRNADVFFVISSGMTIHRAWTEWITYNNLRFEMQSMHLETMRYGGPVITTNDPAFLPYVFADAVFRRGMLHQGSE
jgi:hypothetical protein